MRLSGMLLHLRDQLPFVAVPKIEATRAPHNPGHLDLPSGYRPPGDLQPCVHLLAAPVVA